MCFKGDNLINDIPFMLFMEEQERKEKEAADRQQDINRDRCYFGLSDNEAETADKSI